LQDRLRCLDEFLEVVRNDIRTWKLVRLPCNKGPGTKHAIACTRAKITLGVEPWREWIPSDCRNEDELEMLAVYDVTCK
jgi:hypothetical protein